MEKFSQNHDTCTLDGVIAICMFMRDDVIRFQGSQRPRGSSDFDASDTVELAICDLYILGLIWKLENQTVKSWPIPHVLKPNG